MEGNLLFDLLVGIVADCLSTVYSLSLWNCATSKKNMLKQCSLSCAYMPDDSCVFNLFSSKSHKILLLGSIYDKGARPELSINILDIL